MPAPYYRSSLCLVMIAFLPAACTPAADGIDPEGEAFTAVAPDEVITLTGTEPFWGIKIADGQANYNNPDNLNGWDFAVTRFAGNNGLGFSGTMNGEAITIALTPGACSDGMSDRAYPYVATIALGEATLRGCGYTTSQPFVGDAAP